MLCVGDIVRQGCEEGIVVCEDPPIMRLTNFHCYVAITDPRASVIGKTSEAIAMPPDALIERVRAYLLGRPSFPTGA